MSRQTIFTDELADLICDRLLNGESLRQICSDESMPNRSTVFRWMEENEAFATKCARAREAQAEYMDDLVLDTANACTPQTAMADRVKIAAYQWRASKLKPKKYGEKITQEHTGKDGERLIPPGQTVDAAVAAAAAIASAKDPLEAAKRYQDLMAGD